MVQGDFFSKTAVVSSGSDIIIDGSTSQTGAAEVHTFAAEASQRVVKEIDTTGDGVFDVSIELSDTGSELHSQKNKIEISQTENIRLRIENTAGTSQGIHVSGIEVSE